jgi:hypothetical protein
MDLFNSAAIANLTAARSSLIGQREHLDRQIAAINQALAAFGAHVPAAPAAPAARAAGPQRGGRRGGGGRGVRPGSLKDYIHRVLAGGGVMAVKDIAAGVVKAGFKSKNKTLAKSVGIALAKMPGVKRVGRGKFRAA